MGRPLLRVTGELEGVYTGCVNGATTVGPTLLLVLFLLEGLSTRGEEILIGLVSISSS